MTAAVQRRRAGALAGTALALAVAASLLAGAGRGQGLGAGLSPQPVLGAGDAEMVLMGAGGSAPGEAWGYRALPLSVGAVTLNGQRLEFAEPANPVAPEPQLAFVRHTDAAGWQVAQTPLDEDGQPYRGMSPNRLSARITPGGGGVLVGRDTRRPVGSQAVVLQRSPGGRFQILEAPPPEVLLPADGGTPGEVLAADAGTGRLAVSAFDAGGETHVLFGALGRAAESAVIHWDGSAWSREEVELPSGSEGDFKILALAAAGASDAWLLARTDPALGRGIVLFERETGGPEPRWVERPLGAPLFGAAATPAQGISGVQALGDAAQPLTATGDGVWIDGSLVQGGAERDFTLFFDQEAAEVTGSWCELAICEGTLGAELSRRTGYRSFAWSGPGFGSRVITNPLDDRDDEATNRGTWLRFDGAGFSRMPGAGGNFRASGAFSGPSSGWLEGPVQITAAARPDRFRSWPLALRAPLTDVTGQPGAPPADLGSQALAVGPDGGVARYTPSRGWIREFLLTSSGAVNKATLRGVAWPEAGRAHAVGDLGAMWEWDAATGLWEADAGAPVGFEADLMDVAFQPGDPQRGYAVGKSGVLLRYDKSWEQEALPADYADADLTQVAFAGGQALVAAGRGLLVNDGGGWREDPGVKALLDPVRAGQPQLFSVAGLPDGGAVVAGRDIVLERDSAGGAWRFSDQPLPGSSVIAAAAVRDGGRVRAIVSVVPRLRYPPPDDIPPPDPTVPPPIIPPFPLPGDGYVLRETQSGWVDEQRAAFSSSGNDKPLKTDPVLGFLLDASGNGWAVGGWSGEADSAGRGSSARNGLGRLNRQRVRTAAVFRYGASPTTPPAAGRAEVPLPAGPARFAVAGHAQCDQPCADLSAQGIAPDRTLTAALQGVAGLAGQPGGPRALLYTGSRSLVPAASAENQRYATLLGSQGGLAVFPAPGGGDVAAGASSFQSAFAAFPAPFGSGPAPPGIDVSGVPGGGTGSGGRTHYAFDSTGAGGTVRVVVIDNSLGSLAASDPHQNPPEQQAPWLAGVLADAKAKGIPSIVLGSRDLNPRFTPALNAASDGDAVAQLLVENGASAYLFDRPEENRATRVPAGAAETIPSFGTGTLGYRSPVSGSGLELPDSLFGDSGYLLLEVDTAQRDPATNRAPVSARLIPVIEELSLEATDGTLLRRSRVALFRGLGRRPRAGDRWGRVGGGDGNPSPPGADPYTNFPPEQCVIAGCSTRITPEYQFTSSDPDIGDFVRQDPNSTNLRKPFLDANDKVVSDSSSGLFCTFNAGTTTVTIKAGGFSYSDVVRVLPGSVLRPCGTRPLRPDRFQRRQPEDATPPPPPPPAPASSPPLSFAPPPPPAPVIVPAPRPSLAAVPGAPPILPVPLRPALAAPLLATVLPPPPALARPLPPGGAPARVYQREEEEEAATEESQAFARYEPDPGGGLPPYSIGLVLLLALAGATIRGRSTPRPAVERGRTHR